MERKRQKVNVVERYALDQVPECLSFVSGDAIRWNGTKHWNYVVQTSENYLLTRRCSKWGWRYILVSRKKNLATVDMFGETRLQYESLLNDGAYGKFFTDDDFLQTVEEKKPFNKWLLPPSHHVYFLEVKRRAKKLQDNMGR